MSLESNQRNRKLSFRRIRVIKLETAYTLFPYVHILVVKVGEEVLQCRMDTLVMDQSIQVIMVVADSTSL
jgi:hypothetical protein